MQISENMAKKLNDQIRAEFFSYWTYLAMAYKLHNMGYKGFAAWYEAQAAEEMTHATKMAKYLVDVGAEVKLGSLDTPKSDYGSVQEIVKTALEHEQMITGRINDLIDEASKENDRATENFLSWYIDEQVEEESTARQLLDMVELATDKMHLLLLEGRIWKLRNSGGDE